jgi:hypothetical protein
MCILICESLVTNPTYMQELLKALIGFIDVAGLYFALTQLTHRNISQNHKFQAVGLGEFDLSESIHLNGSMFFPKTIKLISNVKLIVSFFSIILHEILLYLAIVSLKIWPQLLVYFFKKKGGVCVCLDCFLFFFMDIF